MGDVWSLSGETPQIWHTTLGSPANPPLLLLHSLVSCHLEFTPLLPDLRDTFFIILVDLPGHSRSPYPPLTTTNLTQTVDALASLVRSVTPKGKAHVAGISYGGFVGLELARRYPGVVMSLFVSGATPFAGLQAMLVRWPRVLWSAAAMLVYLPDVVVGGLYRSIGVTVSDELRAEMRANLSVELLRTGYGDVAEITMRDIAQVKGVRTAVVAGGKQDDVPATAKMGRVLREGSDGMACQAFVVRKAYHGWDLQFPKVFAQGITAWVEERAMPSEYEELL
ncbi:Alpha/Beta hydrolase protein [Dioszegia hungarica]|uniref:Alpha/Beta hydrolase protein n=1 Tax=Dioszegia hungarica TaxID=4972 RepID=A0AA38HHJ6_9TREE|nr:Alpha/Beta hydrolase protein [Dioszegia hungarica]KAI9639324.1 Alpha/Beta hydrolase protein [Dioszegia hungarica]